MIESSGTDLVIFVEQTQAFIIIVENNLNGFKIHEWNTKLKEALIFDYNFLKGMPYEFLNHHFF